MKVTNQQNSVLNPAFMPMKLFFPFPKFNIILASECLPPKEIDYTYVNVYMRMLLGQLHHCGILL